MLDLGFVAILAFVATGLGTRVLKMLGATPDNSADTLATTLPLGLGAIGLATLVLGELGWLNPTGFLTILVLAGLFSRDALDLVRKSHLRLSFSQNTFIDWPIAVALGVGVLGSLLTALAPVTDGDALCYHLQVPKWFLARGAVGFDPDLHETVYPLLTEMLYALALGLRGPVACRVIQWLLGLVFLLNVTALARPSLGPRAWWAGAVALLVPAVSNGMSAPLNDVALAAFGTTALVGWTRFQETRSTRSAVLVGILTGMALGVKYPALVLAAMIGLAIAARSWREPRRIVACAFAAVLVGGVWYARAYAHTGNPVYPFFRQVFGGSGLDEVLAPEKRPLPVSIGNIVTALGPMTLDPDRFDSVSHQFGPAFLLFLPLLLIVRPPRQVLGLTAIGYGFLMICLTQRQSMRFLLIAIGPMSVGVAWLGQALLQRRTVPGRLLVGAFLAVLAFESAVSLARARHGFAVASGRESADAFLARREPTFQVGRWVAANLPGNARIIGQDHRGYYFPRDYTMELAHRRRTGLGKRGESPNEVVEHFRQAGYTHLLLCPPEPVDAVEFDPTLGRLLDPWIIARRPIYREKLTGADGVVRNYALYVLEDDSYARTAPIVERTAR